MTGLGMQTEAADVTVADGSAFAGGFVAAAIVACAASAWVIARLVGRLRQGLPPLESRPHPQATWTGSDVAGIALVYVALLSVAGIAAGPHPAPRLQLAADIATKAAATLAGIAALRHAGASWTALGLGGGAWRDDLRIAAGGLALVLAPLLGLAAALDRIVPYRHPIVAFLQANRDPVAIGLVVVAAVVVAPIAEEFFFRRVLQGWLERQLPEADGAAAVGLAAAAFAAAHLGHGLAAAPLFLFGVVLGVVARRTGSLPPCVFLHAAFNAVSVGLLLLAPADASVRGG